MTPDAMTQVRFVRDAAVVVAAVVPGARLLDVAQAAGQPLEGTCGGVLACATCHVVIAAVDWPRLPPPRAEEEDMLDLVPAASRHSRLSCQVAVPAGEPLTVHVPG